MIAVKPVSRIWRKHADGNVTDSNFRHSRRIETDNLASRGKRGWAVCTFIPRCVSHDPSIASVSGLFRSRQCLLSLEVRADGTIITVMSFAPRRSFSA